jgi:site-specific recombinase XerD
VTPESEAVAPHPHFAPLAQSWDLALRADGYAKNTLTSYANALRRLTNWLALHHEGVGPVDVNRNHLRAWIVDTREAQSSGTARSWFAGVRHFFRWMVAEGERDDDPTEGIKTPAPNDQITPMLADDDIRLLLGTCTDSSFISRRDTAIIYMFADGGLRLAELASLELDAVDVRNRIVFVEGKGSNRSGPRRRAVPLGVKAARALDRYLRARAKHPYANMPQLWLGGRGRPHLSIHGVPAMLKRRGARAGVQLHPHMFRHGWASAFRSAGGSEGDLMVLGGWRSRMMLDRYGKVAAGQRAREAYQRLSYGDRL